MESLIRLCAGCRRNHDAALWFYPVDSLGSRPIQAWLCSKKFHQLSAQERLRWCVSIWESIS
jgi:hypothetical protein